MIWQDLVAKVYRPYDHTDFWIVDTCHRAQPWSSVLNPMLETTAVGCDTIQFKAVTIFLLATGERVPWLLPLQVPLLSRSTCLLGSIRSDLLNPLLATRVTLERCSYVWEV